VGFSLEVKYQKPKKVAGILVTYHPDDTFFVNWNSYVKEVDHWFLLDNGSEGSVITKLKIMASEACGDLTVMLQESNIGLAKAQNICLDEAMEQGYEFVYLLDQDSIPSPGSVRNLKNLWEKLALEQTQVGWIGSQVKHPSGKEQKYWIKDGWIYKRIKFDARQNFLSEIATCISSGSLVSLEVVRQAGGFEEDFFIDYLDIEYCIRLRRKGYQIFIARDSSISHSLGDTKVEHFAGISFYPTGHSPERRFFMMRNRIWTWRKHFWKFPGWFCVDFGNAVFDLFRILALEKEKWKQVRAMGKGLFQGVFQKPNFMAERSDLKQ